MKNLIAKIKCGFFRKSEDTIINLADLPRASCETADLSAYEQAWLVSTFSQQKINAEWAEDELRINSLKMPEMTGGVNPGDRRALYYLVRRLKPARFLEIGTHIGSSTIALALAAARNQADGVATRIVTVDIRDVNDERTWPWLEAGAPASPRELVASLGLSHLVEFEVNTAIEKLVSTTETFDMIFLDGDHGVEAVYREIPLAFKRLTKNGSGMVLLHDYYPEMNPLWVGQPPLPGPFQAVERLLREGAGFRVLPLGELPWPTKLGSNVTSLAVLSK